MGKHCLITYLLLLGCINFSFSQVLEEVNITIVSDNANRDSDLSWLENQIQTEIDDLLRNRKKVNYDLIFCDCTVEEYVIKYNEIFTDENVDIVISMGTVSSAVLSYLPLYPKPAIAGIVVDPELQKVSKTDLNTSGVNNFTYIQSPFDLEKDLETLHRIYPFKNLGIISPQDVQQLFPNFEVLFGDVAREFDASITEIQVGTDAASTLANFPEEIDAVYVMPLFEEIPNSELPKLFDGLIEKGIPSVTLIGEQMLEYGALIGFESLKNLQKIPRRIALNVSKIVYGTNASDIPVVINNYSENLIINMATARALDVYPDWDMIADASLLNANEYKSERVLNLKSTIFETLQNNLLVLASEKDPSLAQKDVDLAKAELFPDLEATTSLVVLDENTTNSSFGARGRLNWLASGSLSQLVYAEPVLANIAIQRLLMKSEEEGYKLTQLDAVLEAAEAYLNILQAKSFVTIQNENVKVTKNNLDIAKAKEAVGYAGATDLNRWVSELALDKIDLNDAQAGYRNSKYNLNSLLNQKIKEQFKIEDVGLFEQLLVVTDDRILNRINNEGELSKLADFLVDEAFRNLPELKQFDYGIAAQERLLKSQKRAFYTPSFAVSGSMDYTIDRWKATSLDLPIQIPGLGQNGNQPTWNLALGASYPIFQGGKRQFNQEKTQLGILQLKDQQQNLRNQMELRVRAALEIASASFYKVQRFQEASEAAKKNFQIIQDSYSQGLVNVTTLIDAQNASLQTELGAINAIYEFILDFLAVERAVGFYYLLATQEERNAFFDRMEAFFVKE